MKQKRINNFSCPQQTHCFQFKEQALERAERDGIPKVAQDLGLTESMLYSWRSKRSQTSQPFEKQKTLTSWTGAS